MKRRLPGPTLALLGLSFLALYCISSQLLPGRAELRRYSSGVLDMDVSRVVADLTGSGPAYRASVHPLQKLLLAPAGASLRRWLVPGDPLAAAQLLAGLFAAAQVVASALLARQLAGGAGAPALAAALLCGASFSSLLAGSIPESAVFASLAALLPLLLLGARWQRPFGWRESGLWAGLAVLGIGLTVSQLAFFVVAFGARLWISPGARGQGLRPAPALLVPVLAAVALVAAVELQSRLYPGTPPLWETEPLAGERPYLRTGSLREEPLRHLRRVLTHFAVTDFAAPAPRHSDFLIRAGFDYWSLTLEEAHWRSGPAHRLLAGTVLAAVLAALWWCPRRDPRFLAPALGVASQLVLHLFYGREYALYSPHWHGVWVALLVAGAWRGLEGRRRLLLPAAALLAAMLLWNNLVVMRQIYREVAFGLEVERRDAEGELRIRTPRPGPGPAPPRS